MALFFFAQTTAAQSTAGLTNIRDTSFSVHREFEKLKKNYPHISIVTSAQAKNSIQKTEVVYCTMGKRKLLLDVFALPNPTKEKRPAVMIIHGGGWRSGNRTQHHPLAQQLASFGYVCFTPEYRLSTEALYPAAVHDLKNALRWIHANAVNYHVDTTKIAVTGFSAGGQLAALLATTIQQPLFDGEGCNLKYSTAFQALVNLDGTLAFIHPESGEGEDSKKTSAATLWFGYSKAENPALWKQAAALSHVSNQTPPTLFINSSVPRMHAGREDYRRMLDAFNIYSRVKTFETAPHSFPLFHPWFDSTVQLVNDFLKEVFIEKKQHSTIVVSQDGSSHFKTVQEAFDRIPIHNQQPFLVYVKNGIYQEKLFLDSSKKMVTLLGEDRFNTILTFDDHTGKISPAGDTINTYTSHSFLEAADDFTASNITFQNSAGPTAGQAVAIQVWGDRVKFINCRFIGNQDVLFLSKPHTRQYFDNCYIEGTTDFIFGPSTAWFERCHIHSKKNSHITAASTPKEAVFGYVFNDCVLTGDSSLHQVSLGRPWRAFAHVVYRNSYIGQHIKPEGWSIWNNNNNHLTASYAEYKNYGPSASTSSRIGWSRQLSVEEAKRYSITNVLKDWDPTKKER